MADKTSKKRSLVVAGALVELYLPGASSLKDKRQVIKSLIQRLKNRYNISLLEAYYLDLWQRAGLGLAFLAFNQAEAAKLLDKIKNFIEQTSESEIIKYDKFYFHPETD